MPRKPTFNAAALFPRIAHHDHKAGTERFVDHGMLVVKLYDDLIENLPVEELHHRYTKRAFFMTERIFLRTTLGGK